MSIRLYHYLSNFILAIILLVCICQFNTSYYNGLNDNFLLYTSLLSVIVVLIYVISPGQPYKIKEKSFFKISTFFLLSYFLVHFSNYLHYSFKTVDIRFLEAQCVNKAALLSLCCFISVILGIRTTQKPFEHKSRFHFDTKT